MSFTHKLTQVLRRSDTMGAAAIYHTGDWRRNV